MALEHLDAGRPPKDGREERRVVDVGVPGERRIERQKPGHLVAGRGPRHEDVPDGRAVVQRLDREEPGHFFTVLVHVLQQESVGPDAQPGVDALGSQGPVFGVEFLEGFLDAL